MRWLDGITDSKARERLEDEPSPALTRKDAPGIACSAGKDRPRDLSGTWDPSSLKNALVQASTRPCGIMISGLIPDRKSVV